MSHKYRVESALPDPVYLHVAVIAQIFSMDEYKQHISPIENLDSTADLYIFRPRSTRFHGDLPEFEPGVQFRKDFIEQSVPCLLDTGDIVPVVRPANQELRIGDQVWYDVCVDQFTLFEPDKFPRKLTLIKD